MSAFRFDIGDFLYTGLHVFLSAEYDMKRVLWIVGGVTILSLNIVSAGFTDILDHQYRESILYLHAREVVKGYPDGTFRPDQSVTRAEMLKIVLASLVDDQLQAESCFPDVNKDERYAGYICYAKNQGIVKGYPDGTFQPDQGVTIAEGLKIALEAFERDIDDAQSNEPWYQPYIEFVHVNSLFSKYALRPEQFMNRGQMAFLVHQLVLHNQGVGKFDGIRESRSAGCFGLQPREVRTSSFVDGVTRTYLTTIGRNYTHDVPSKLIIAFHGRTNSNVDVKKYYRLERARDNKDIIVYPSGLPENSSPRNRSDGGDPTDQLRDFALFDQIVKDFSNEYCLDMDQIYVVGHSLGAWFTNSLACARGDVIRGIGSVGGGTTSNECSGPVAAMIMHHPNDRLVGFGEGVRARDQVLDQNGCGPVTVPVGPDWGNCVQYVQCTQGAPVVWCEHTDSLGQGGVYYPHTRPNDAGVAIREFIESISEK